MAGIQTGGEGWIRVVSRRPSGTLSRGHYTLATGRQLALFDVVEVDVSRARPEPHQPENWVLGREGWGLIDWILGPPSWKLIEKVNETEALPILEKSLLFSRDLLGDNGDRVSYSNFSENPATASLTLVEPLNVRWRITHSHRGRRQTRAEFALGGRSFDLPVTDPEWEERLSFLPFGVHNSQEARISRTDRVFLTLSLGEPFNGNCFKLVAAVILLTG